MAARSPHHQVGSEGSCSSSPSRWRDSAGRKPSSAVDSRKAEPGRVGHQHVAGADGLQQARHAQARIGAQFQRVEELVVQALEHAVHRLQALAAS